MSAWRDERNGAARARLAAALPAIFPAAVLIHAHARPFVPPLPRLAVESYWRAHPLRADRLARALARRGGAPAGWTWRLRRDGGTATSFRVPPSPFREPAFDRGPGHCCLCGQPVYRLGWHRDLWGDGTPNRRARWHAACVAAWKFWRTPREQGRLIRKLQKRRCPVSDRRLLRDAEIDHAVPLYLVWRDHRALPWPDLLAFWGLPNLRAVTRAAHRAKSSGEAGERARLLRPASPVTDGLSEAT